MAKYSSSADVRLVERGYIQDGYYWLDAGIARWHEGFVGGGDKVAQREAASGKAMGVQIIFYLHTHRLCRAVELFQRCENIVLDRI